MQLVSDKSTDNVAEDGVISSEKLLNSLNSALLCIDDKQQISYVNSSTEALFGSGAAKLLGRSFGSLLSRFEPSKIEQQLQHCRESLASVSARAAEITLFDGRTIIADYSIYPLGTDDPNSNLLLEIHHLEHQAQFDQESMSQMQQNASHQLARGLAHEIKNPLGGIRGAAQLLERETNNEGLKEYTDVIIHEVDRLHALIDSMLHSGDAIQKEPVNILEVLEHIRKVVVAAEGDRIAIERDYDPSVPNFPGDRNKLIQVFLNLAQNAAEAIEGQGQISFKTRIGHQVNIGHKTHPLVLMIDISDTGKGISADLSDTVFLPMVTDKPDGSGLGLPIAQDIIFQHGGSIRLTSKEQGTVVSTLLPLERI